MGISQFIDGQNGSEGLELSHRSLAPDLEA